MYVIPRIPFLLSFDISGEFLDVFLSFTPEYLWTRPATVTVLEDTLRDMGIDLHAYDIDSRHYRACFDLGEYAQASYPELVQIMYSEFRKTFPQSS